MNLDWQLVSQDEPTKFGRRNLQRRVYKMPDGTEKEFVLILGGRTSCVVALTQEGNVLLARQFRPGQGRVLWELPGGAVDGDEDPQAAAARELLEETGYECGSIEKLGEFPMDAYSTREAFGFLARDCVKVSDPKLSDGEFVETVEVSKQKFSELVLAGEMTDMPVALLALRKMDV